jgi:hypothetical protein
LKHLSIDFEAEETGESLCNANLLWKTLPMTFLQLTTFEISNIFLEWNDAISVCARFPALSKLTYWSCVMCGELAPEVIEKSLPSLQRLSSLTIFDTQREMSETTYSLLFENIHKCTRLESLDIGWEYDLNPFYPFVQNYLSALVNLRSLSLGRALNHNHLLCLAPHTKLEKLNVIVHRFSRESFESLTTFQKLRKLTLHFFSRPPESFLTPLATISSFESLRLKTRGACNLKWIGVQTLTGLQDLRLSGDLEEVPTLLSLSSLKRLAFSGSSHWGDDGMQTITAMPQLRQLKLPGLSTADRSDPDYSNLCLLTNLRVLHLSEVTDLRIGNLHQHLLEIEEPELQQELDSLLNGGALSLVSESNASPSIFPLLNQINKLKVYLEETDEQVLQILFPNLKLD